MKNEKKTLTNRRGFCTLGRGKKQSLSWYRDAEKIEYTTRNWKGATQGCSGTWAGAVFYVERLELSQQDS